ncbi:Leucine-rich repeat domain, L domain-like [Cinara cedri]|uniref:Leucine-rich repeat domain, L domain-like n=1 Tax=Cinara cedri TaxID=506608 RepID=A0A5E4MYX8_9HEMI|nr:Leucine-rich repeat domain, L domain-like [Cinara cedri]
MFLKKITNLRSLRLENCHGQFLEQNIGTIRSMKNLKKLELINAVITDFVAIELGKCHGITALLIISLFEQNCAHMNNLIIDCLLKLKNTLTHLVWGITFQYLRISDIFIQQYQEGLYNLGYSLDLSEESEPFENMAVLRSTKLKLQSELSSVGGSQISMPLDLEKPENDNAKNIHLDVVSVAELKHCLKSIFGNTKVKIIKILTTEASQVFLSKHFDDF